MRILVDTVPECYTTLGIVHSLWQPIPGEFDDYIANPKGNGYKSLHTVIVGPKTKAWKCKSAPSICTNSTNSVSPPTGVTKRAAKAIPPTNKNRLVAPTLGLARKHGGKRQGRPAAAFKTELFNDTIYVLTPHGKVLSLPTGATPSTSPTPLHSSIGDRCRGAKVEGQIVPLSTPLENGQRVEIITAKEGHPSVNWLYEGWVKSSKAISKIRAYIRQQNADTVREEGRVQLDKQLAKLTPKPNL